MSIAFQAALWLVVEPRTHRCDLLCNATASKWLIQFSSVAAFAGSSTSPSPSSDVFVLMPLENHGSSPAVESISTVFGFKKVLMCPRAAFVAISILKSVENFAKSGLPSCHRTGQSSLLMPLISFSAATGMSLLPTIMRCTLLIFCALISQAKVARFEMLFGLEAMNATGDMP